MVPDESEFSRCVPLVIWTCTLGQIANMIKESELDRLSTPWAVARVSCLLSRQGTVVVDQCMAGDNPVGEGAIALESSLGLDMGKPTLMKENVRLGPFQTQIMEYSNKLLIGESARVMVMSVRAGESQPGGHISCPLDCMSYMHTQSSK